MIITFLCLGTSLLFSPIACTNMEQPPEEGSTPEDLYAEQKRLEEEDLLSTGPGEEEANLLPLNSSLLDVSMDDADGDPSKKPANPSEGAGKPSANPTEGAGSANPTEGAAKRAPDAPAGRSAQRTTDTATNRNVVGCNPIKVTPPVDTGSNKMRMYITAKKASKLSPIPDLYGGDSKLVQSVGNLITEGDNRWHILTISSNASTGINIAYSFDPNTNECGCCGKLSGGGGGEEGGEVKWCGYSRTKTFPP
jgi:hypothetical protein